MMSVDCNGFSIPFLEPPMFIKSIAAMLVVTAASLFAGCQSSCAVCDAKADKSAMKACCAQAAKAGTVCKVCHPG